MPAPAPVTRPVLETPTPTAEPAGRTKRRAPPATQRRGGPFVFSTELANAAARAVVNGQVQTIVEYLQHMHNSPLAVEDEMDCGASPARAREDGNANGDMVGREKVEAMEVDGKTDMSAPAKEPRASTPSRGKVDTTVVGAIRKAGGIASDLLLILAEAAAEPALGSSLDALSAAAMGERGSGDKAWGNKDSNNDDDEDYGSSRDNEKDGLRRSRNEPNQEQEVVSRPDNGILVAQHDGDGILEEQRNEDGNLGAEHS